MRPGPTHSARRRDLAGPTAPDPQEPRSATHRPVRALSAPPQPSVNEVCVCRWLPWPRLSVLTSSVEPAFAAAVPPVGIRYGKVGLNPRPRTPRIIAHQGHEQADGV